MKRIVLTVKHCHRLAACYVLIVAQAPGVVTVEPQIAATQPIYAPPTNHWITGDQALASFKARFRPRPGLYHVQPHVTWEPEGPDVKLPIYRIYADESRLMPGEPKDISVRATDGSIAGTYLEWPYPRRSGNPDDRSHRVTLQQAYDTAVRFAGHTYPGFARTRWAEPSEISLTLLDADQNYFFQWRPRVGAYSAASWPPLDITVDSWRGKVTSYSEPDYTAFDAPPPPVVTSRQAAELARQYAPIDPTTVPTQVELCVQHSFNGGAVLMYTVFQKAALDPTPSWIATLNINAYNGRLTLGGPPGQLRYLIKGATVRSEPPSKPLYPTPGIAFVAMNFTGPNNRQLFVNGNVAEIRGGFFVPADIFRELGAQVTVTSKALVVSANGHFFTPPTLPARKFYGSWWIDCIATAKLLGWPAQYDSSAHTIHIESDPVSFNNPYKLIW